MMGQTDAQARIPKPSSARTALEHPTPMERTNGTVTGPVVTPAESHAMLMKSSFVKAVRQSATRYLNRMNLHARMVNVSTVITTPPLKKCVQSRSAGAGRRTI